MLMIAKGGIMKEVLEFGVGVFVGLIIGHLLTIYVLTIPFGQ